MQIVAPPRRGRTLVVKSVQIRSIRVISVPIHLRSKKNFVIQIQSIYFVIQSAFMNSKNPHLDTLQDIKQMMERSSRFISLSGFSGIAAGTTALIGAWFAREAINEQSASGTTLRSTYASMDANNFNASSLFENKLFIIASITFIVAFILSFIFTYLRSKKTNTPLWGKTAQRLLINVMIPMLVGGLFILKLVEAGNYGLIAPGCLIFYGLALVNASKFTLTEIRYLGYAQLVLGVINLWFIGKGLYFWAAGFGMLHIVYGIVMWNKYERNN